MGASPAYRPIRATGEMRGGSAAFTRAVFKAAIFNPVLSAYRLHIDARRANVSDRALLEIGIC